MRIGNAAENCSVLLRIALNLFRQDKTSKVGVKTRRLLAASYDAYRLNLLSDQGLAGYYCPSVQRLAANGLNVR